MNPHPKLVIDLIYRFQKWYIRSKQEHDRLERFCTVSDIETIIFDFLKTFLYWVVFKLELELELERSGRSLAADFGPERLEFRNGPVLSFFLSFPKNSYERDIVKILEQLMSSRQLYPCYRTNNFIAVYQLLNIRFRLSLWNMICRSLT